MAREEKRRWSLGPARRDPGPGISEPVYPGGAHRSPPTPLWARSSLHDDDGLSQIFHVYILYFRRRQHCWLYAVAGRNGEGPCATGAVGGRFVVVWPAVKHPAQRGIFRGCFPPPPRPTSTLKLPTTSKQATMDDGTSSASAAASTRTTRTTRFVDVSSAPALCPEHFSFSNDSVRLVALSPAVG